MPKYADANTRVSEEVVTHPEDRMSREKVHTKLVDKHHSPLIVRKYTHWGFPVYIAVIADDDLSDLDTMVVGYFQDHGKEGWVENIQKIRDLAGSLTEHLVHYYGSSEGVAVIFYVDKMFVSSLYGDFMNHLSCKMELYEALNMMTLV